MSEFTIVTDDTEARIFSRMGDSATLREVENVRPAHHRISTDQFADELARYVQALAAADDSGRPAAAVVLGPQRFLSELRSRVEAVDGTLGLRYIPWDHGTSTVEAIANGLIENGTQSLPRGVRMPGDVAGAPPRRATGKLD